jgi:hypothetical protein
VDGLVGIGPSECLGRLPCGWNCSDGIGFWINRCVYLPYAEAYDICCQADTDRIDLPTTSGKDPIVTAQSLAKFVIAYGFDGVDIDYEDMGAMNSNAAEAWLVSFQRELRNLLPEPYLISHAPVAPWFTSAAVYQSGAYVAIDQAVGDTIDFYNVQFYNQGDGVYEDCYVSPAPLHTLQE